MFSAAYWLLLLCFILGFILFLRQMIKYRDFDKIPGPKELFLVGNSLDFLMDTVSTFIYFRKLTSDFKNIFKLNMILMKCVFIYTPQDVEALLSGTTYNKKGYVYRFLQPWLNDGLLLSYGAKWQQRRKILTPAFHFNILRCFHSILITKCNKLVGDLDKETDKNKTDISPLITDYTLNSICETAMGTSLDEELNDFGKVYKNAVHDLGMTLFRRVQKVWYYIDLIYKFSNLSRTQNKIIHLIASFRNQVIQSRRENPYNLNTDTILEEENFMKGKKKLAMLDILLKAEDEGKIDENGISEEVDTFMFEGHDTTATALQFTFMLLANHTDVQNKIVEELKGIYGSSSREPTMNDLSEMKYLECCIKESLRLYPPVHFISRTTEQPLKLQSYTCPINTEIVVFIYDLHRQPDQFPNPLKYIPERFMVEPTWHHFAYIPFSAGPRNCIGQKFAMMEMKLVISSVLQKYRMLPVTRPQDLVFITDLILRTRDPIYVKFEKRLDNLIS